MTERAQELLVEARTRQLLMNDARRIRTKVAEARNSPEDAGGRWPFELLQNATDAGARAGRAGVTVRFECLPHDGGHTIRFVHDGAPFKDSDLAALLSGGSSKEFESEETTGRFGTGFLVSHVLSYQVRVTGLLAVDRGLEEFTVSLDRSGNEQAIAENQARTDIVAADVVSDATTRPSAVFEWITDDLRAFHRGVAALEDALPLVFGTTPRLQTVILSQPDGLEVEWRASPPRGGTTGDCAWTRRDIVYRRGGEVARELFVTSIGEGDAAALFLAEKRDDGAAVVGLPGGLARLFRRFPVRGTAGVSIGFVLEAPFTVNQERKDVLLTPADRDAVTRGLVAGARLLDVALDEGLGDVHLLARAAETSGWNDEQSAWWRSSLAEFIEEVVSRPVVRCARGILPACEVEEGAAYANFPRLSLQGDDDSEGLPLPRVLGLMARVHACNPPLAEVAEAWTRIAREWEANGVSVVRIALARLGELAAEDVERWDDLAVDAPREWLCEYIDAVGEAWENLGGVASGVLSGLVPDQTGTLHDPSDLRRDDGIPEELKDIAVALGHPIREQLLSQELVDAASEARWIFLDDAIVKAVTVTMTTAQVVDICLKTLETKLAAGRKLGAEEKSLHAAALRMVRFLLANPGPSVLAQIGRIPVLMRSGQREGLKTSRIVLLPVSRWPAAAQPFAQIWSDGRILDELWADDDLLRDLAAQSLVYEKLVLRFSYTEVAADRFEWMLADAANAGSLAGFQIKGEIFTNITLLQDIISRCNADAAVAKLLFQFIVGYVAREDESWRRTREVIAHKQGAALSLRVRDAYWLGVLRGQNWVPSSEQGSTITRRASEDSLRNLLDPAWLKGNSEGIALLSECFGFDRLELELSGKAVDRAEQLAMREQLAQLVGVAGGSPEVVRQTIVALAERKRQIELGEVNRAYGIAVQEAVHACLVEHGLKLELVDHGFDYEVKGVDSASAEGIQRHAFKLSGLLIEVKATTGDEVSLTPLQAMTAGEQADKFVLCVVPFNKMPERSATRCRSATNIGCGMRCRGRHGRPG